MPFLSSALIFAIAIIRFIHLICNLLCSMMLKKEHFDCPSGSIMKHLREFVTSVPEYRRTGKGNFKHKLEDILILVILGRPGKCITGAGIIKFGKRYLKRFHSMGILPGGLPSEAALCRVFKSIDDEAMACRMSAFMEVFRKKLSNKDTEIIVWMVKP